MAYHILRNNDTLIVMPDNVGAESRAYLKAHDHIIRPYGLLPDEEISCVIGRMMQEEFRTRAGPDELVSIGPSSATAHAKSSHERMIIRVQI